jgi:tetratricopeptide (TPR) repeat protein
MLSGRYENSLSEFLAARRLFPENGRIWASIVGCYRQLSRLGEARATAEEAERKNLDSPSLRHELYLLAFLQNDSEGMKQQVEWSRDKPGVEAVLLNEESGTASYWGRFRKARRLNRRAVASCERAEDKEAAALYEADEALREALFGYAVEARGEAASVQAGPAGADALYNAALALAMVGETVRAQELADDLARLYPESTAFRFNSLPTLRAQIALSRNDPSQAIELLQVTAPYELSDFYPVYVRAEAYLSTRQGGQAEAEFKKILDSRGVLVNSPFVVLAQLGICRAYVLQGDAVKARANLKNLLELWKDADPDLPILIAAKSEYGKLQ